LLAEHLLQFAVMGSALVSAVEGKENPRWACSTSAKKPSRAAKSSSRPASCCAMRPAEAGHLNFYGNVEGNDIFKGTTDIVVCDGFVGNVTLKTAEGLATLIGAFIKQEFSRNLLHQAGGIGGDAGA
jgi:glycerol-3-phosphate acyltransferase PlsX